MNREFTIAFGWKLFYSLLAVGMLVFAGFLLNEAIKANNAVLLIPIVISVGALLLFYNLFKSKILVTDDSITRVGIFKTSEIATADIKGVRVRDKSIVIELTSGSKITLSNYSDYGDSDELKDWLKSTFTDLDAAEYDEELTVILNDSSLGFTEEDRKEHLTRAKIVAVAYSIGGAAVAIGGFFLDSPAYTILALIYPLLGIPVIATSKGLIKLIVSKKSPYYHIFIGIEFPPIMLLIKGISGGHVLQYSNFWLPAAILTLVFIIAFNFAAGLNNSKPVKGQIILLLIFGLLYGAGGTLQTNTVFDQSTAAVYRATVLDHHISHGKSTTYYLTLSPWGPQPKEEQIEVSRYRYNHSDISSTVSLHLKKGMLNIPWFMVSD